VNYIGFGPLPDPRFAFAVRVTHQRTSQRVRRAAYAVTRRFLRSLAGTEGAPLGVTVAGP
jgi:cell division protein FtsI/penicillin-binding protein 2